MSEPNHTNAKLTESASASSSIISRDGIAGMMARMLLISLVMFAVAAALILVRSLNIAFVDVEISAIAALALAVWFAMILGLVFSEYPRGDELLMSRVGLATFCRTGLPLLVILLAFNYATRLNSVAACVGILYAVGLASSLALEIRRLASPLMYRQAG